MDDDQEVLLSFRDYLNSVGFFVADTRSGREALEALEAAEFDIILSDLRMPGTDGIYFLEKVRRLDPYIGFVIFTAFPSVSTAVRSMKSLADDYLEKPISDFDRLHTLLEDLIRKVRSRRAPKSGECLIVGKPGNPALIQGLWENINPKRFSGFLQREKTPFGKGYVSALTRFIRKKISQWPDLDFTLLLKKGGMYVISDSSCLPVEAREAPCRRTFDAGLMEPQGKHGGKLVVVDTSEEVKKYPGDKRRDRRIILLPLSFHRKAGYLWIQCSPEVSVDIRLLALLTEITSFAQWLTMLKEKKAGKKPGPAELKENRFNKCIEASRGFGNFIGASPLMKEVYSCLKKIASIDATVLITGETGTGKELAAQTIHQLSSRRDKPFLAVNCASISETLIESELFGHEKGAFTSADCSRVGLFESVDGGTIFFDEIGEISPAVQTKMLRVLQEKEIRKVGSTQPRKVDVRVITSTNRNLLDDVYEGKFRKDLYYRLNVVSVHLPPLKDRGNDIRLLTEHFLSECGEKYRKKELSLAPALWENIFEYPWPGNVRELVNVVEKMAVMSNGGVISELPLGVPRDDAKHKARMALNNNNFKEAKQYWIEEFEKEFLSARIKINAGSVVATAKDVGMDAKTVRRKVKRYGIVVS